MAASAAARSGIPTVGQRLGVAQRKLALVRSAAVNRQAHGDRDPNGEDLMAALLDAVDEAYLQVHRIAAGSTLQELLDAPAPDDDRLDRLGSQIIEQAEAVVDREAAAQKNWNDESFVFDTVWSARREIGSFTKLYEEVQHLNGLVELVYHALEPLENDPDSDVNVTAIRDSLGDARRRFGNVYSAVGHLAELDKDADDDEAQAS